LPLTLVRSVKSAAHWNGGVGADVGSAWLICGLAFLRIRSCLPGLGRRPAGFVAPAP
jgi:hypothetical protein